MPTMRQSLIVGEAPAMESLLVTRTGEDEWQNESLFETVIPPLVGARRGPARELRAVDDHVLERKAAGVDHAARVRAARVRPDGAPHRARRIR